MYNRAVPTSKENSTPPSDWPRIGLEKRILDVPDDDVYIPRSKRRSPREPYFAAVVPRISTQQIIEIPGYVAAAASEAAAELARFDAELSGEFANFTSILLRSESASSSEIENLTANAQSVALAEFGDRRVGRNAQLIVANTTAMNTALEFADNLDESSLLKMHAALLADVQPESVGGWRDSQVRIGGHSVHDATFVPPHPERVPAAMEDLIQFIQRTDIPALIHAALAHAQFETIHPFPDGNGRVGRALIHAMYRHAGLTRHVTVPVSAGILSEPNLYFETLTEYRSGNPIPVIQLMTTAAFRGVENGRWLAGELRTIRDNWRTQIRVRAGSTAELLIEFALRQPVLDSSTVQRRFDVSQQAADEAIKRLHAAQILAPVSANKRNRRWAATDVLDALNRFAERTRRLRAT